MLCARAVLRFSTDPDTPGTEKLAVAEILPAYISGTRPSFSAVDICQESKSLLAPMSLFHVKGWTRACCAITCLLHAYTSPDEVLQAGLS